MIENVRLDGTFHSLGVMAVVRRARRWLKTLMKEDPPLFYRFPVAEFLAGPAKSTVWALRRDPRPVALPQRGKMSARDPSRTARALRLQDVLRLDVLPASPSRATRRFCCRRIRSPGMARRQAFGHQRLRRPGIGRRELGDVLGGKGRRLAADLYNRQRAWIAGHGVDISLPDAFYYGRCITGRAASRPPRTSRRRSRRTPTATARSCYALATGRRETSTGCASTWSARRSARRRTRCQSRWPTRDRRRRGSASRRREVVGGDWRVGSFRGGGFPALAAKGPGAEGSCSVGRHCSRRAATMKVSGELRLPVALLPASASVWSTPSMARSFAPMMAAKVGGKSISENMAYEVVSDFTCPGERRASGQGRRCG